MSFQAFLISHILTAVLLTLFSAQTFIRVGSCFCCDDHVHFVVQIFIHFLHSIWLNLFLFAFACLGHAMF